MVISWSSLTLLFQNPPTVKSSYSGSWLQDSVRAVNWWESSCAVPLPCLGKKHSKQPSTYLENLSIPSWVSTAEPWGKTHDTDVSFRTDYSTVYWTQFYKLWTTIYSYNKFLLWSFRTSLILEYKGKYIESTLMLGDCVD